MFETIIKNEFNKIWSERDELLGQALVRKNTAEYIKTDGLARLDEFFSQHRKTVKEFLDDRLKKITEEQESYLEDLYDQIVVLIGNCIPEKGGYNCKQRVKYKEIVIVFLVCFKKWKIMD